MKLSREVLTRLIEKFRPEEKKPVTVKDPKALQLYAEYKLHSSDSFTAQELLSATYLELLVTIRDQATAVQLSQLLLFKCKTFGAEYFQDFIELFRAANNNRKQDVGQAIVVKEIT